MRRLSVPLVLLVVTIAVSVAGATLYWRSVRETNHVALSSSSKGVTVIAAKASTFRSSRRYVATLEPWLRANVGPQLVAAYVDTVLVRPGLRVKRGDVIATLDCRSTSASDQAVAASARALDARRTAIAKEAARVTSLLDGGFVSPNEAEQKTAEATSLEAQLAATKAQLTSRSLEVSDCALRAPFDGEVAERLIDPGAFVRPGQWIASVVDRSTIRIAADVPETDFEVVAPGTDVKVRLLATGEKLTARIARRSPSADASTRTVRAEIDLVDSKRLIPVGTTAELSIDVGESASAIELPLSSAAVRGTRASLFVVEAGVAHKLVVPVLGEREGRLFLAAGASIAAGAQVVTEGRALLADGDHVDAATAKETP